MDKKFVFLILHYFTIEDTRTCVDSIFKFCSNNNFEIVIVDNGSTNGTGKILEEEYSKYNNIHVIISEKNLGFSKGNNIGFEYIKEKLNADYIIMLNSDTLVIQNNFCELIDTEYQESGFSVLGPRIILNNNQINTYGDKPLTIKDVKSRLKTIKRKNFFNNIHLLYLLRFFEEIYNTIFVKILKKIRKDETVSVNTSIRKEGVVLQGCCLIFSKNYINLFNGINDDTFLYNEEQLLFWRIKENNLLSVFNPYLFIYHNESSSVKKTNKGNRKRMQFILQNEIKSYKILLDKLKQMEE